MSNEIPNIIHSEHISNNQISNNFEILSNTIIRYMELEKMDMILPEMLVNKISRKHDNSRRSHKIEEMNLILKYMEKNMTLVKEKYGVIHACPNCNTILKKAICNCNSSNITKKQKIFHPKCGHIGDSDHFITNFGMQCPHCGDIFKALNDSRENAEYRYVDSKYVCDDCGDEFKLYKIKGSSHCVECDGEVEHKHSKIYNLDIYKKR